MKRNETDRMISTTVPADYNTRVAALATSAIADTGHTVADAAQWLGQPVAYVAAKLRGEDELLPVEMHAIARRCGQRVSTWLVEVGL